MMRILLITFMLLSSFGWLTAQKSGFDNIEKLSDMINTTGSESQPMLAPGGDTLYFIRSAYAENLGGEFSGQDIWYSARENGKWTEAKNTLENLNSSDNNAVIGINASGDQIYLINTYSPPVRRNRGVVYAKKGKGVWSAPKELDIVMDIKGDFYGFYMNPSEDVLLISMNSEGTLGNEDLYVSLKENGEWSDPIHMGNVLNTTGFEISPFLSANKGSIYFASNGHGGLGDADIYVSARIGDGWQSWSPPVNLGAPVNSETFDAYYFMHGQEAYFTSNREGNNDIFKVGLTREPVEIEEEEEEKDEATEVASVDSMDVKRDADGIVHGNKNVTSEKPSDIKLAKIEPGQWVLYFDFDSYKINDTGKKVLETILAELNKYEQAQITISIEGYADNAGSASYNLQLSEKRARQVVDFLTDNGFDRSIIGISAKGEANPVASNDTETGRQQNRRAVVNLRAAD